MIRTPAGPNAPSGLPDGVRRSTSAFRPAVVAPAATTDPSGATVTAFAVSTPPRSTRWVPPSPNVVSTEPSRRSRVTVSAVSGPPSPATTIVPSGAIATADARSTPFRTTTVGRSSRNVRAGPRGGASGAAVPHAATATTAARARTVRRGWRFR